MSYNSALRMYVVNNTRGNAIISFRRLDESGFVSDNAFSGHPSRHRAQ
jgi:hypothetical protein